MRYSFQQVFVGLASSFKLRHFFLAAIRFFVGTFINQHNWTAMGNGLTSFPPLEETEPGCIQRVVTATFVTRRLEFFKNSPNWRCHIETPELSRTLSINHRLLCLSQRNRNHRSLSEISVPNQLAIPFNGILSSFFPSQCLDSQFPVPKMWVKQFPFLADWRAQQLKRSKSFTALKTTGNKAR